MLVVEIELLGGRYVATEYNDRSRAEWPPHPARFYSALVAALHDGDPVDAAEREALLWLEQQPAPHLRVDLEVDEHIGRRDVRSVFVPVNDVTTLGRDEERLRVAQATLDVLRGEGRAADDKDLKRAVRGVAEAEAKLAQFLAKVEQPAPVAAILAARGLLPSSRNRQERTLPTVIPPDPTFAFIWVDAPPVAHRRPLAQLCARVTRLGHSSSLVRCAITDRDTVATLVPRDDGEYSLRVVGPGQLDRLEGAYARHQAVDARILPARPQRYGIPIENLPLGPQSVFGTDWIIYERIAGDRPLSSRGPDIAAAFRRALIETHGREDLPMMLSGHAADGSAAQDAHLAFLPLPWVDHPHADASVQGVALVLPRTATPAERDLLSRLLAAFESARGDAAAEYAVEIGTTSSTGQPLVVQLRRVVTSNRSTLRVSRWSRASRHFVTATPILLDRYPGNLRSNIGQTAQRAAREAAETIETACAQIGLPRPTRVDVSHAPLLSGAQSAHAFVPWPRQQGRAPRVRVHAALEFAEPVRGPLVLGAGRYFGLGLCLPVTGPVGGLQ